MIICTVQRVICVYFSVKKYISVFITMKLYYENVEDFLHEYATLTKTIIFSKDGQKLFSMPDQMEFSKKHYLAVIRCMADSLHPLAGITVGNIVYKCLRVDDGLLVGRSDNEELVAYKGEEVVIVGFNNRGSAGDCCLTDVKNVERELYRVPESEQLAEEEGDPTPAGEGEEAAVVAQETMLQSTVAKPQQTKPKVMFSDEKSPAERHVNSARKLPRGPQQPLQGTEKDLEVVNEAFESNLDDEDSSFEKIDLEEVPQAAPEDVELRHMP